MEHPKRSTSKLVNVIKLIFNGHQERPKKFDNKRSQLENKTKRFPTDYLMSERDAGGRVWGVKILNIASLSWLLLLLLKV